MSLLQNGNFFSSEPATAPLRPGLITLLCCLGLLPFLIVPGNIQYPFIPRFFLLGISFTLLVGIALYTGAYRSRRSAFLLLLFGLCAAATFFTPALNQYTQTPQLIFLQICTLFFMLSWKKPVLKPSPFYLPALIFFAIIAISASWAPNPYRSVGNLSRHLSLFLFFLTLYNTHDLRDLRVLLIVNAWAGAGVALIGIAEYLGLLPLWIPSTGRPSSTFGFRNLAALYLIASLPFVGLLVATARNRTERLTGLIACVLMSTFLVYIRGRASWVGLSGALLLHTGFCFVCAKDAFITMLKPITDRAHRLPVAISGAIFVLLILLPPGFTEPFNTQRFDEKKADIQSTIQSITTQGGDRGRRVMWRHTLSMIADAPVLGVGLGNWEFVYPLYDRGEMISPKVNPFRPHNDLLWIWSETGTPGLLAFLSLPAMLMLILWRLYRRNLSPEHHQTAFACGISVMAILGAGFFDFPWDQVPPYLFFWLSLAIVGWLYNDLPSSPASRQKPVITWGLLGLLVLSLGISAHIAAFDYYYIRAYRAFLTKDHTTLAREADRAVQFGAFDHQIFIMQGDGHLHLEHFEKAEQSYLNCLKYHPNFANAYSALGHLHYTWGKKQLSSAQTHFQQAHKAYEKALQINPKHYIAYYNLGLNFEAQNQIDKAILSYKTAYQISTDYTKACHNLGVLYRSMGQIDSALVYYQKALSGNPPTLESLFNLGNL